MGGTEEEPICEFETSDSGSTMLPAGSDVPVFHIEGFGYAETSSLSSIETGLSVNSISPSQSSFGGQIEATMTGSGFPLSMDQADEMEIVLCGAIVEEYISVSNEEIVFIVPTVQTCSGSTYEITVNGKTSSIPFTYNAALGPSITSLSVTSSSPILKKSLVITGSSLGNISSTTIFLYDENSTKKYELNAVEVSSTEITCILGGGRTGSYDVVVIVEGTGASSPSASSKFWYKIVVTNVETTSNSMGGGYNMTITGYNFSPEDGSNNAFIGDAINNYCTII